MTSIIKLYGWITAIIIISSSHGQEVADSICREANENIITNKNVDTAFEEMMLEYNEGCLDTEQCAVDTEPVNIFLTYDYSWFTGRLAYNRLKNTCESKPGYKICDVTSQTVFRDSSQEDGELFTIVTELNKPVCFPPSCSPNQVSILEPTPATCNPNENSDCQILSYSVQCPQDFTLASDTSTCSDDVLPSTSPFYFQRSLLEAIAISSCTNAVSTQGSKTCTFEVGTVSATTQMNFADFESSPSYLQLQSECSRVGGQICRMDMSLENIIPSKKVQNITVGDVMMQSTFHRYPQCMPNTCTNDQVKTLAAQNFGAKSSNECRIDSNDCNVTVSNIVCLGLESVFTAAPVESPTNNILQQPVVTSTNSPGIISNPSPAISPPTATTATEQAPISNSNPSTSNENMPISNPSTSSFDETITLNPSRSESLPTETIAQDAISSSGASYTTVITRVISGVVCMLVMLAFL